MLPLSFYTHPHVAPLNLATMMPKVSNPTDLGPKTYIASGQIEEHEGEEWDSVTKLHQDMSDAVNILLHCQMPANFVPGPPMFGLEPAKRGSSYHSAGAVWDIWRMQDVVQLRSYIQDHSSEFRHQGIPLDSGKVGDVIFDHCFLLGSSHLDRMMNNSGVIPWHFEQYEHEAVMIPAGCPHQVRNLRACIKVAVDFVSPEALGQTFKMADMLSECHMKQIKKLALLPPPPPPFLPQNFLDAPPPASEADVALGSNLMAPTAAEATADLVLGQMLPDPIIDLAAPVESIYQDKLQGRLIMMSAAVQLYKELHSEPDAEDGPKKKEAKVKKGPVKSTGPAANKSSGDVDPGPLVGRLPPVKADAVKEEPLEEKVKEAGRKGNPMVVEAAMQTVLGEPAPAPAPAAAQKIAKKKGSKSKPHKSS